MTSDHASPRVPQYERFSVYFNVDGGAHTQLDIYDEIYAEDLKQASVVLAIRPCEQA